MIPSLFKVTRRVPADRLKKNTLHEKLSMLQLESEVAVENFKKGKQELDKIRRKYAEESIIRLGVLFRHHLLPVIYCHGEKGGMYFSYSKHQY